MRAGLSTCALVSKRDLYILRGYFCGITSTYQMSGMDQDSTEILSLAQCGGSRDLDLFEAARHARLAEVFLRENVGRNLAPVLRHEETIEAKYNGAVGVLYLTRCAAEFDRLIGRLPCFSEAPRDLHRKPLSYRMWLVRLDVGLGVSALNFFLLGTHPSMRKTTDSRQLARLHSGENRVVPPVANALYGMGQLDPYST